MRSAVLRRVLCWAGPLLLAAVALAFDAADRRIPFGVWTTGPVDEVAHLCTAALGLLVLARFIAAPLLCRGAHRIGRHRSGSHTAVPGAAGKLCSAPGHAFAVHRGRVRCRRGGQSQAPGRAGRGGNRGWCSLSRGTSPRVTQGCGSSGRFRTPPGWPAIGGSWG